MTTCANKHADEMRENIVVACWAKSMDQGGGKQRGVIAL
jgi:hypothetical protein